MSASRCWLSCVFWFSSHCYLMDWLTASGVFLIFVWGLFSSFFLYIPDCVRNKFRELKVLTYVNQWESWYLLVSCHSCFLMKATFPSLAFVLLLGCFVFKQSTPTPHRVEGWRSFTLMPVRAERWVEHKAQLACVAQHNPGALVSIQQQCSHTCRMCAWAIRCHSDPSSVALVQTPAWLCCSPSVPCFCRVLLSPWALACCRRQSAWCVPISSPDTQSPFYMHPFDGF